MNVMPVTVFLILLAIMGTHVSSEPDVQTVPESHAWEVLRTRLDVEERSWLLMWDGSDQGQLLIEDYLRTYPSGDHREQALYLKAVGYWNVYDYANAVDAYGRYIEMSRHEQRLSLAMTRHLQSLLRSDRPSEAITLAAKYSSRPGSEQRELVVVDALLLQGKPDVARTLLEGMIRKAAQDASRSRMLTSLEDRLTQIDLIGKPLPSFDIKAWRTGRSLTPQTFHGRILLLEFWATWCKPCMVQMPKLVGLYERHHEQGFDILGVDLDEDPSRLAAVVDGLGMRWPQFNDERKWKNSMAVDFNVRRIPHAILVDRSGIVRYVSPPASALDRLVLKLLEESASERPGDPVEKQHGR